MKKISIITIVATAMLLTTGCSKKKNVKPVEPTITQKIEAPIEVQNNSANDVVNDGLKTLTFDQLQGAINTIYFDSDQYGIRADMQSVMATNADVLNKKEASSISIVISGHCDEWGSDEYNFALGQKRAVAVKKDLESKGVVAANIRTVSKGEGEPICSEKNEECWAQNRRAEIQLAQ